MSFFFLNRQLQGALSNFPNLALVFSHLLLMFLWMSLWRSDSCLWELYLCCVLSHYTVGYRGYLYANKKSVQGIWLLCIDTFGCEQRLFNLCVVFCVCFKLINDSRTVVYLWWVHCFFSEVIVEFQHTWRILQIWLWSFYQTKWKDFCTDLTLRVLFSFCLIAPAPLLSLILGQLCVFFFSLFLIPHGAT